MTLGRDERDEWIRRALRRMESLTRHMMRRYPVVRGWVEPDDVLAGALLRLDRALRSMEPESLDHFCRLAAMQIRRELIDLARYYRRREPRRPPEGPEEEAGPPLDESGDPAELAEWAEFHAFVESLGAEERGVMDLIWYMQLTQAEAAALLGASRRTLRRRWARVRGRLRGEFPDGLPGEQ
jgi:RNA polymerase sigma factor (sigma-70 family)